jgi:hypothetical protein
MCARVACRSADDRTGLRDNAPYHPPGIIRTLSLCMPDPDRRTRGRSIASCGL